MHDIHIHMDGRDVVLILQVERHEGIGSLYPVDKVAPALDHPLVHQLLKGLFLARHAQVVQEFVPEATIHQMSGGVLGTSNVERSEERRVGKECRSRWSPYH